MGNDKFIGAIINKGFYDLFDFKFIKKFNARAFNLFFSAIRSVKYHPG
jgi:hypothetical protein